MDRPLAGGLPCGASAADVARFTWSDEQELVEAALACMLCLGAPGNVRLELIGQLVVALIDCGDCGARTLLELDAAQSHRLASTAFACQWPTR